MKNYTVNKFICWLIGCNYICLHRHKWENGLQNYSTSTGWQCVRCGDRRLEQWDS